MVQRRAFQLITEEARATPDVVTAMYFLLILLFMLYVLLICLYCCLGLFLVINILALVLFDSGATRSFVSLTLCKRFGVAMG